jgi:hypothetical protein
MCIGEGSRDVRCWRHDRLVHSAMMQCIADICEQRSVNVGSR